jgi:hypothetical protein
MDMQPIYVAIDPYVIWFFRMSGYTFVDFLIGTFVLAFIALIVGEFTISLAFLAARKRIDTTNAELTRYQNLSLNALRVADTDAYHASNKLANDAFGKSFFMQVALSAAFLWPIFFVLDWMQWRFSGVEFEFLFLERTVGPVCVFIPLYAAVYLIFKRTKHRLPYFKKISDILDAYHGNAGGVKPPDHLTTSETKIRREAEG